MATKVRSELNLSLRAAVVFRWGIAAVFALVFAAAAPATASEAETLEIVTATGPHIFGVEIAADDASREQGLMFRRHMPENQGMLFEFDKSIAVNFWMKNTYIALDLIFVAEDGTISRIAANAQPFSESLIPSGPPCKAVLELNGGGAAKISLKIGDHIHHPFFAH